FSDGAFQSGGAARILRQRLQSASWAEGCFWRAVDPCLRWHGGQYRVLHLLLRQRRRIQDLARPIQFHLRKAGGELDDRGSSFVGHAPAAKVIVLSPPEAGRWTSHHQGDRNEYPRLSRRMYRYSRPIRGECLCAKLG